ncbi:unnamed protein product, partial [Sphacelaria rigidula]
GLLRRSYCNWSSPLVVVNEKDGGVRLTCKYRKLNEATIIPVLPIPTIGELLDELGDAKVFTCLGILSGYFNISIHSYTTPPTAVCTQTGLNQWLVMPIGCGGSPGWFQSIMARVL